MKSIFIIAALGLFSFAACTKSGLGNNSNTGGNANVVPAASVPSVVISSFNNNFSGATGVEWQRHSSSFEVQFNHSNQRHSAGFDDNGHQSSHSIICIDAAVPQVVLDVFRQRFPSDNVYEWKLRNDGTWRAHFLRSGIKFEATFSATGVLLKFEQSQ